MKKTLLAIAIGALAVVSTASANSNFYVQGDLGYSKIKLKDDYSFSKNKFTPSIAVGYDFGDWRLAADYSYFGKIHDSYTNSTAVNATNYDIVKGNGEYKVHSLGFSAIYDINLNSAFEPYVGARIALNRHSINDSWTQVSAQGGSIMTIKGSETEKETKFGYGVLAGVQYKLTSNLAINGGIEWNRLGKFDDTTVNQYGAKVGLRYDF